MEGQVQSLLLQNDYLLKFVTKFIPTSKLKLDFPDSSVGKESAYNEEAPGLISGSGRSAGEGIGYPLQYSWAYLVVQLVKNLPAMRETWVQSLDWEDPLKKERLPTLVFWPREFQGLYRPWSHRESDTTEQLSLLLSH